MMKLDLSGSGWRLSGWTPFLWKLRCSNEVGTAANTEIAEIPARVPGSVQLALRENGLLPDWNIGMNRLACEWTENRHWMFRREVELPEDGGELVCEGLDYSGWILWDGREIGTFCGSHRPHCFPLPPEAAAAGRHSLAIIFDLPPRWLGQFGDTAELSVGKPRFYYSWDWMPRLVQTAITGSVTVRSRQTPAIRVEEFDTTRDSFRIRGTVRHAHNADRVRLRLADRAGREILRREISCAEFEAGIECAALPVECWNPNGLGNAALYDFTVESTVSRAGKKFRAGFRSVRRRPCEGAPEGAEHWVFEINGTPLFIQGINWTPLLPNYADTPDELYRARIAEYREIGVNLFRVWGGASRERELFYELCDEAGIMVWQEFPLCSSGIGNLPPDDPDSLAELERSADAYLDALVTHPALILWCGGNELFHTGGAGRPCSGREPALQLLARKIRERDPGRDFVPTSASGPAEYCLDENYGKGMHHDVHGPWKPEPQPLELQWTDYWNRDDALFRSEFGAPGAASEELIRKYAGGLPLMPVSAENPLWRNPFDWWLETDAFAAEHKRPPESVAEYVAWSRHRQGRAIAIAAGAAKRRFPKCGGVIVWMGHDAYPCFCNTSLIDFDGNRKPAADALQYIFTRRELPVPERKSAERWSKNEKTCNSAVNYDC